MLRDILNNDNLTDRVGVVSMGSLQDWLYSELIIDGIDLGYESFLDNITQELLDDGLPPEDIEDYIEDNCLSDHYDSDGTVILFGDWCKDSNGLYIPDIKGSKGFSATFHSGAFGDIVMIDRSKWCTRCNYTSPCFVMSDGSGRCGDLDSAGDILAMCLPEEYYTNIK